MLRLVLAAGRGGTAQWDRVFDVGRYFEASNEYLPALPAFDYGPGFLLDRFAELVPSFPVHVAGHPPGLLLVMHALGIDTAAGLAALCIAVGVLSAPLTYGLARELLDERAARLAGLLMALSPAALMFGVTSADAVYLTVGLLAAWPLARGWRVTGAVALAVASMFAWSLLAIGAWAAILELRRARLAQRVRARRGVRRGAGGAARRVLRADRVRPDRHGARDGDRLPRGRGLDAALLVLGARLAGRLPARARAPDLVAGAARAGRTAHRRRSPSSPCSRSPP